MDKVKVESCEREVKAAGIIVAALAAVMLASLSGCIKKIVSGDTTIDFITGADFSVGFNGVDTVQNERGIKPGEGYRSTSKEEVKY
jgi:hypothetical protein